VIFHFFKKSICSLLGQNPTLIFKRVTCIFSAKIRHLEFLRHLVSPSKGFSKTAQFTKSPPFLNFELLVPQSNRICIKKAISMKKPKE
jgi:hypothetical protein